MSSGLVRLLMLNNNRTAKFQIFGKATLSKFTDAFIRSGQDRVFSYQQKF
jgi:hypothetical protein